MKYLKKIAEIIIYLLVLYYIGRLLVRNWRQIDEVVKHINYLWLILSFLLSVFIVGFQSFSWHTILRHFRPHLPFKESYRVYFKSNIARYLPGGLWSFLARTYMTAKLGFTKAQVLFLIIIESVLVALTSSLVALVIQPRTDYTFYLNLLLIVLSAGIIIFLIFSKSAIKIFKSLFKKEVELVPLPPALLVIMCLLYTFQLLITGLAIFFLAKAFMPLGLSLFLPLLGIYAASWVIGFIIIYAPSGLGIRETVFIVLLSSIMGAPYATLLALASRIVLTLAELVNFFISLLLKSTGTAASDADKNPPQAIT